MGNICLANKPAKAFSDAATRGKAPTSGQRHTVREEDIVMEDTAQAYAAARPPPARPASASSDSSSSESSESSVDEDEIVATETKAAFSSRPPPKSVAISSSESSTSSSSASGSEAPTEVQQDTIVAQHTTQAFSSRPTGPVIPKPPPLPASFIVPQNVNKAFSAPPKRNGIPRPPPVPSIRSGAKQLAEVNGGGARITEHTIVATKIGLAKCAPPVVKCHIEPASMKKIVPRQTAGITTRANMAHAAPTPAPKEEARPTPIKEQQIVAAKMGLAKCAPPVVKTHIEPVKIRRIAPTQSPIAYAGPPKAKVPAPPPPPPTPGTITASIARPSFSAPRPVKIDYIRATSASQAHSGPPRPAFSPARQAALNYSKTRPVGGVVRETTIAPEQAKDAFCACPTVYQGPPVVHGGPQHTDLVNTLMSGNEGKKMMCVVYAYPMPGDKAKH